MLLRGSSSCSFLVLRSHFEYVRVQSNSLFKSVRACMMASCNCKYVIVPGSYSLIAVFTLERVLEEASVGVVSVTKNRERSVGKRIRW